MHLVTLHHNLTSEKRCLSQFFIKITTEIELVWTKEHFFNTKDGFRQKKSSEPIPYVQTQNNLHLHAVTCGNTFRTRLHGLQSSSKATESNVKMFCFCSPHVGLLIIRAVGVLLLLAVGITGFFIWTWKNNGEEQIVFTH